MSPSKFKLPHLLVGLATGSITVAVAGFVYLYLRRRRRQKLIEDEIKGVNRKKTKKPSRTTGSGAYNLSKVQDKKGQHAPVDDSEIEVRDPLHIPLGMQERAVCFEMRVAKSDLKTFIGTRGINIRKIQKETNTRIVAKGEELENGDKIYQIVGLPDDVGLAESKINMLMMSQPVLNISEMIVPDHTLGKIIGNRGENIRLLQDVTHARIDIPRIEDDTGRDFTDDDYEPPKNLGNMRAIKIKGTDEQIADAKQRIQRIVEADATMQARIHKSTSNRTPRQAPRKNENPDDKSKSVLPVDRNDLTLQLRQDKTLEVFVSCVYTPNRFYFQRYGSDAIQMDKLCDVMTDYYKQNPKGSEESNFSIGDLVVVHFDDDKMYRAKILEMDGENAKIMYIDYGDIREYKTSELRKIRPEFLKLRFQAILATFNLDCLEEAWTDAAIDEMTELTRCATWNRMKAKVLGYIKDSEDPSLDTIWLELYDSQEKNIADILIEKGLAGLKENQPTPPVAVAPIVLVPVNEAKSQNGGPSSSE